MSKPRENPRNNENKEFRLFEAGEYFLKILILFNYQIKNNLTQNNADMANIELEEIIEINFSGLFHHIVSNVISKDCQENRGHIMESLNIPKFGIVTKEVIQYHENIILSFFSLIVDKSTSEPY